MALATIALQMEGRAAVVAASIGGQRLHLVLDTGANVTVLRARTATALHLAPVAETASGLLSIGGVTGSRAAAIPGIEIGGQTMPAMTVAIEAETPFDGVLGLDVLQRFDVDIDYPHRVLGLHPPGACRGTTPPADPPFQTIQATRAIAGGAAANAPTAPYLMIPATLDGASTLAMLDTGAMAGSLVSRRFAAEAGVSPAALARDPAIDVDGFGTGTRVALHRFTGLRVARETLRAPSLLVGGDQQAFAVVLGWDYFAAHRVWLDFATNRVLVSATH